MNFQDSIGMAIVEYTKYVEKQNAKGKKAVSFIKYAFGNM
jgi:hypothetical protein